MGSSFSRARPLARAPWRPLCAAGCSSGSAAGTGGSGAGGSGGAAKKEDPKQDVNAAIEKYLKEHPTKAAAGYDKAFFIRNPNGPEIFNFDFKFQNWFDE